MRVKIYWTKKKPLKKVVIIFEEVRCEVLVNSKLGVNLFN